MYGWMSGLQVWLHGYIDDLIDRMDGSLSVDTWTGGQMEQSEHLLHARYCT